MAELAPILDQLARGAATINVRTATILILLALAVGLPGQYLQRQVHQLTDPSARPSTETIERTIQRVQLLSAIGGIALFASMAYLIIWPDPWVFGWTMYAFGGYHANMHLRVLDNSRRAVLWGTLIAAAGLLSLAYAAGGTPAAP